MSEIENKVASGVAVLRKNNGSQFNTKEINRFFNQLKAPMLVDGEVLKAKGIALAGKVSYSKNVITVRNRILEQVSVIENGLSDYTVGSFINKNKPFSAVFNSPNYSYFSKSCFEDKKLLDNIQSILNVFNENYDFSNVVSEKDNLCSLQIHKKRYLWRKRVP